MSNFSKKRRRNRRNKCDSGKVRFRDRKEATDNIQYFQSGESFGEIPCRAYKCRECEGWHLTSKPSGWRVFQDGENIPIGKFENYLAKRVKEFFSDKSNFLEGV